MFEVDTIDFKSGALTERTEPGMTEPHIPEECTLMQFTGLKDKNGKEIYEGDVVHYCYQPGKGYYNEDSTGDIKWKSTGFMYHSRWLVSIPGLSASDEPNQLLEVISNIYENPDLLTQPR